ncbi:MAG: hypothetical protein QOD69_3242, partial [Solirubrobacteraceae bacterium]|nr:hypothetical protein [Solirubrobacteraceae bacterium]
AIALDGAQRALEDLALTDATYESRRRAGLHCTSRVRTRESDTRWADVNR